MPTPNDRPRPWLVAAWPGMGNVAVIAANVLVAQMKLEPVLAIGPGGFFDIGEIHVVNGLIEKPRMPRSVLHRGVDPATGRHILLFLGEAQPNYNMWSYANGLLDKAAEHGVERVVTFASMASTVHPKQTPKVHGAATTPELVEEIERAGVKKVEGGQIGGLNGVLLGAASERGIPGLCLMGEIPFYAANLPNPKASRVVLSVFSVMAGLDVSLAELDTQSAQFEGPLTQLFERLREQAQEEASDLPDLGGDADTDDDDEGDEDAAPGDTAPGDAAQPGPSGEPAAPGPSPRRPEKHLDPALRARLERLFEDAQIDRKRAVSLKEELDRLGVFEEYEDRFLDLFKRAE